MIEQPQRVVVLGGGISGLSAAFYLQKHFREQDVPFHLTLLEQSGSYGGKINTLYRDGFVIERGPDSFLSRKMPIIDLTRELGLEDQLVGTNPQAKKTYILYKGRLHRIPPGLVLGIPTKVGPFSRTGLLSVRGKLRAALDLILPRRDTMSDESLGSFLQRRLGKEVLDHIAEPLLAGIYAGDTHALSLQSTFPQFQEAERKYRSLILGMVANKKTATQVPGLPDIAKQSVFLSYKKGLRTLVDGLVKALQDANLRTNCRVTGIEKVGKAYRLQLDSGETMLADGAILALPAYEAAKLVTDAPTSQQLQRIPYVSVANVILAFDKQDIHYALDGSGFVVPRTEGRFITACTFTSSKWQHTAPEGKVLVRCYVGRSGDERWISLTDEQLLAKVQQDLQELTGIDAKPLFYEINAWKQSMPQYPLGHLEHLKQVRAQLALHMPGIFLAGAGYHGVGLPDCIRQGKEAAEQMGLYLD